MKRYITITILISMCSSLFSCSPKQQDNGGNEKAGNAASIESIENTSSDKNLRGQNKSGQQTGAVNTGEWRSLFNGKNLEGWIVKLNGHKLGEDPKNTFRVENGVMKVSYDQYDGKFDRTFGHIFYHQPFSNYHLRLEYRFTGEQLPDMDSWAKRNSGIMIHGQPPESMGLTQGFPASIEVQLLGGLSDGKERSTGNLCTPATHVVMSGELITKHCINSSSQTYDGDQWVQAEVIAQGNVIRHIVNGEQVLQYSEPQLDDASPDAIALRGSGYPAMLSGGSISLQSESHPVEFRNIEIKELDE